MNTKPYEGLYIMMAKDPGQLPSVGGIPVWENTTYAKLEEDLYDLMILNKLSEAIHLYINYQIDRTHPDTTYFNVFYSLL